MGANRLILVGYSISVTKDTVVYMSFNFQIMEKTEKGHIEDNEVTSSHKITGILLIILTLVVYITAVSFNYLSSFGGTGIAIIESNPMLSQVRT